MTQIKKVVLMLLLLPSLTFGDCPKNVQPVKQGDTANCDGFLFSKDAEKTAADARDDAEYYKSLSDKLTTKVQLEQKESDLLQQRLTNYRTEAESLSSQLGSQETNEGVLRGAYFLLGVVVTAYIAKNVR